MEAAPLGGMTRATVLLAFAPLVLACSSTEAAKTRVRADAGLDASANASDAKLRTAATDACNAQSDAYCKRLATCFPTFVAVAFGDEATCAARVALECIPSILAQGSKTTPDDARACAGALGSADCADLFGNPPDACKTKPGTLSDGSPCAFDAQCAGRLCVAPDGCGKCTSRAAAGASCSATSPCDYGLVCAGGSCVAPQAEGASCADAHPCKAPLQCRSGKCTAPGEDGAACDPAKNAPVSTCDGNAGLWCEPTSKKCKSVVMSSDGTCGRVNKGADLALCSKSSQCVPVDGGVACMSAAHDNASCAHASCLAPARCVSGTCTIMTEASCQ